MIKLNAVTKVYTSNYAIGPLNLTIPASGLTSLIGPNGAGKSSMLLMIGRLLAIDGGDIQVASLDVACAKSGDLARLLAILRQENHFVTRLSVRQLVGFGRYPYSKGRLSQADEAIISKYLDFFNLTEIEHAYLDELSGGQRQRAYVAMVICQETDYVLLDEPLNNLDIAHSVQMMQHLRRAADEFGRTIVVVLHDLNFAARYSDNICAMKNGQIKHFGSPKDIITNDILTDLFDTPVTVYDSPQGPTILY